ncbi:C1QL [Mytilus edulis]|uniref:C1QL n=1 Tax=Mytilus edulis TaxID=6550 RepID=A0A8S3T123_MYTED|nr:C1QL [Mytilus edulis]
MSNKFLFGCIYIPPENSKYSSEEAFTEIEEELLFFSHDINNIALVSDFNSRTGHMSDIVEIDENLFDMLDIVNASEIMNENTLCVNNFIKKGIPLERYSEDKIIVNNYGRKLIELCKRCSLCFANGRLHQDKFIGKNTCKDASLVDYLILSPDMFDLVMEFEIFDFDPTLSDVHNQMHFSLCITHKNYTDQQNKKNNTYVRWNTNKAHEFTQVLSDDTDALNLIKHTLENFQTESVTPLQVNDLISELGNVLLDTASTAFGPAGKQPRNDINLENLLDRMETYEKKIAKLEMEVERMSVIEKEAAELRQIVQVPGTYAFTWTVCASGDVNSEIGVELVIDNKVHGSIYVDSETHTEEHCSTGFVIHTLKTGDVVYTRSQGAGHEGNSRHQRFLLDEGPGVAFSAYKSASFDAPSFGVKHTFIYDHVECNVGNGYENFTGIFRPSVPGTYAFTWTVCASGDVNSEIGVELVIDNKVHGSIYVDSETHTEEHCSTGFVIHTLKTGDVVYTRSQGAGHEGTIRSDKYARTTFSGWLLFY